MAKATKVIHRMKVDPEVAHEKGVRELETLLVDHKETLKDIFDIVEKMREREILNMVNSSLGQSDKIITRIVTALDASDTPKSVKNAMLLFQLLGNIDMEQLEPIALKINSGIARAAEYEHEGQPAGYGGLLGAVKDPEVIEGMNVLLCMLKGMGEQQDAKERVEPQKERLENPGKEMGTSSTNKKSVQPSNRKSNTGWYVLAAGAWGVAIPLLMKGRQAKDRTSV
ncbi:DUF1641 domain-containing protein [Salinicoccus sp. ID82-1]|uniref:DUF1641 domain-containing protein n=1 Tax=Salinicoccus cyprini TaxID=2493691 RepID=A0A558AV46_9STAP|nr:MULTISPECIES: DUF1641 domain-containing protein [Salinicoccus]MCG1010546.1 DUF1641 domain-containing protein [Salinicoccus sp. ID82-1]TVT28086.1 DUF1641 domain-containing protein [Salinicoccus cyprini]